MLAYIQLRLLIDSNADDIPITSIISWKPQAFCALSGENFFLLALNILSKFSLSRSCRVSALAFTVRFHFVATWWSTAEVGKPPEAR